MRTFRLPAGKRAVNAGELTHCHLACGSQHDQTATRLLQHLPQQRVAQSGKG